jgi:hypothetical protein
MASVTYLKVNFSEGAEENHEHFNVANNPPMFQTGYLRMQV